MLFDVNIWAMFAGGLSAVVVGFVWYAPAVFGTMWITAAGVAGDAEEDKKNMPKMALIAFIAALVLSWVLSQFALVWGALTVGSALELGFWIWLGFMLPILVSPALWEKKSLTYLAINAGYWLTTTLVISVIVSVWS